MPDFNSQNTDAAQLVGAKSAKSRDNDMKVIGLDKTQGIARHDQRDVRGKADVVKAVRR